MQKKVALLDVDGTLIDSNNAHAQAWVEAFEHFGYEVSYERIRELIGKGGDKLMPEAVGVEAQSPRGQEITKYRAALFAKTYLPQLLPFPRAKELLEALKGAGLALVVASSAGEKELGALLAVGDFERLVEERTSSSDADESKPAPDIVQAALRAAGCKPSEALMLGDTPWDVEAARRAGVQTVALRCGGWRSEDLAGAVAVYEDPADLLEHLETSPFLCG